MRRPLGDIIDEKIDDLGEDKRKIIIMEGQYISSSLSNPYAVYVFVSALWDWLLKR